MADQPRRAADSPAKRPRRAGRKPASISRLVSVILLRQLHTGEEAWYWSNGNEELCDALALTWQGVWTRQDLVKPELAAGGTLLIEMEVPPQLSEEQGGRFGLGLYQLLTSLAAKPEDPQRVEERAFTLRGYLLRSAPERMLYEPRTLPPVPERVPPSPAPSPGTQAPEGANPEPMTPEKRKRGRPIKQLPPGVGISSVELIEPPSVKTKVAAEIARIKDNLRQAVASQSLTFEEIGIRMGFDRKTAKSGISYILGSKSNPALSTLLQLATAINKSLSDFI